MKRSHTREECRENANGCRLRADVAIDPRERARWINLANLWEKKAAELETAEAGHEKNPSPRVL
jgi:hypothetical protein